MARPRKFIQKEKDGRYFVQVTNGSKGRVHLGTKDRTEANRIGRFIVFPWYERKLPEVRLRVNLAATSPAAINVLDEQLTDFDAGGGSRLNPYYAHAPYADEVLDDPDIAP